MPATRRIVDRSLARKLIALLAVLTAALTVALARDHRAAGSLAAEVAGRQTKVDDCRAVLDALGVMLEPARVQGNGTLGLREHVSGALDSLGGHAGMFGDANRVVRFH